MHVLGDGERQFGAGVGQRRVQWLSIWHPAQQVDVVADQAVVIAVHGSDVGGGAYLNPGGRIDIRLCTRIRARTGSR